MILIEKTSLYQKKKKKKLKKHHAILNERQLVNSLMVVA